RFAPFGWAILKPFYPLFGKSHVTHAVERAIACGRSPQDIFFFIEDDMIPQAKAELQARGIAIPYENFIPEILGRDSTGKEKALEKAAMFGMAAQHIAALRGPYTVMVFERSDLVLQGDTEEETRAIFGELGKAIDNATTAASLEPTIGILGNPPVEADRKAIVAGTLTPPSGKGYIFPFSLQEVDPLVQGVQAVNKFHEKPRDNSVAQGYIANDATYNGSYFIFSARSVLKGFEYTRPEEEFRQLMTYGTALSSENEAQARQTATDYFVHDTERRVPFEQGVAEKLAPVSGTPDQRLGLVVAPLGQSVAKNWVGSQGTLAAVWGSERSGSNYI
ncbi:MAG: hypothetical protein Q8R48_03275, partial [Candidatus Omnitrophota bacterium]|nr:hypothetical protein [Candidatus Omnitrophota bacterium]